MGMSEKVRTSASSFVSAASFSSEYRPRQPGVMRPTALTAVASKMQSPAPDCANCPICAQCQGAAVPSTALNWHRGEMMTRFFSVRPASLMGVNRCDGIFFPPSLLFFVFDARL